MTTSRDGQLLGSDAGEPDPEAAGQSGPLGGGQAEPLAGGQPDLTPGERADLAAGERADLAADGQTSLAADGHGDPAAGERADLAADGHADLAADGQTSLAAGGEASLDADRRQSPGGLALPGDEAAAQPGEARRPDRVPWLIALAVFVAYATISLYRYWRLEPTSWDLGIFTEYVKQYAHLHAPIVDIRGAGINLLGDHFHPIVALIAPFFRLFPSSVTLLVAQALLAAVSVVPVSRAAADKLGTGAGRAIGTAYGFSWGLQQMVNYDFHEIAFAVPLLAFSLSALVRGRYRAAVLWALPLVLVKEDQGLTLAAIGFIVILAYRRPGAGLLLTIWGLAWSLLAITVIIPHFSPTHHYLYWYDVRAPGSHLSVRGLVSELFTGLPTKVPTVIMILLPTAFIALRSPLALVAVPSVLLRFVVNNSYYWSTDWHYNATVMPILFIAAIDAMARIRAARDVDPVARPGMLASAIERHGAAMMLAIAAALAFQFPLSQLWTPSTYTISPHVRAAEAAMAKVPDGATVATDLDLLAPLASRTDTFWLGNSSANPALGVVRGNPAVQYVVFDTQSTDYQPPFTPTVLAFVESLNRHVRMRQIYENDGVYVFVRAGGATSGTR